MHLLNARSDPVVAGVWGLNLDLTDLPLVSDVLLKGDGRVLQLEDDGSLPYVKFVLFRLGS